MVLGKSAQKKYAARIFISSKVGHGAVGNYLARIGVIGTRQCWWCGQAEQSVEHLYTKVPTVEKREAKAKLLRTLYKEGIRWQGWTERKGASIIAHKNEEAMGPFLDFFEINRSGWKRKERGSGS